MVTETITPAVTMPDYMRVVANETIRQAPAAPITNPDIVMQTATTTGTQGSVDMLFIVVVVVVVSVVVSLAVSYVVSRRK